MLIERRINLNLRFILIVALVIRLAVWLFAFLEGEDRILTTDSFDYLAVAGNILQHGEYSISDAAPFYPEVFRTPGYPAFLSLFVAWDSPLLFISLVQVLLSVLTVMLSMRCVQLFVPDRPRLSFLAGWLMALDIPSILFSVSILSETLFAFLFVFALYFLLRSMKSHSKTDLLMMSVLLGVAVWVRPIILYFPLFLILILYKEKIRSFSAYAAAMGPFLFFILLWMGLNLQRTGSWFYTCVDEFNLAWFQASNILVEQQEVHINEARTFLFEEAQKNLPGNPYEHPVEFYHELKKVSLKVLAKYPFNFLKNAALSEFNLFFRPSVGHLRHHLGETDLNSTVYTAPSYSFLLISLLIIQFVHLALLYAGVLFSFLGRWAALSLPAIILLYFMIPGTGPEMEARFRIPLLPVLLLLSMAGYAGLLDKRKAKGQSVGHKA